MALRKILDYWWIGPVLALAMFGYFGYKMLSAEKQTFLPGRTSSGHHQIEIACARCHTPFGGVKQEACLDCHGEELGAAMDSHAAAIFDDPRSFSMLEVVDATRCVSCHSEHIADLTQDKSASIPRDFCFSCHNEIATERPSHKGMAADGCAASGCHNYHDNRALYEDFLAKHLDEDKLKPGPANVAVVIARSPDFLTEKPHKTLTVNDQDGKQRGAENRIIQDWAGSRHAQAGVNCSDCHQPANPPEGVSKTWSDHPVLQVCEHCHANESKGFLEGKHGMRLASELPPMSPGLARIPMKTEALDKTLTCNTCHSAHRYDTRKAAAESCLRCHNDIHSKDYPASPHHRLWLKEVSGSAPEGSGVSCATCHMPRLLVKEGDSERVFVTHNQNANLSPNSKMIRTVCLDCHGLGFTLDALADPDLLLNNYFGAPKKRIESLEMVRKRQLNKALRNN